jgi:hypothetical protein
MPPAGLLFTNVTAPIDTDMNESAPSGSKVGRSGSVSILGLVAIGDASVSNASQDADINVVHNVEYEYMSVLFLVFQQFTIVVHGE